MQISIDSKIQKILNCQLSTEEPRDSSVNQINHNLQSQKDCLLVVTPASIKTQFILSLAASITYKKNKYLLLPSAHRPFIDYLLSAYPPNTFHTLSFANYLKSEPLQDDGIIFLDECETLESCETGTNIESIIIETAQDIPLVLAMNSRGNADLVARWISDIRKRPCEIIRMTFPKKVISTFFSHKGEWLTLLDKKKLNRKIKNHLKSVQNKAPYPDKVLTQTIKLLYNQQLLPSMFVMPDQATALKLWKKYSKKETTPGHLMTIPQVISHTDNFPRLKNSSLVSDMLIKRAAICLNDPPLIELIEILFIHDAFDIVFVTPDTANNLYCLFKSIIFMGHENPDNTEPKKSTQLWYDQLLMRLGTMNTLNPEGSPAHFFYIVTDAPNVQPVAIKDYLDTSSFQIQSFFRWCIPDILGKMIRRRSPVKNLSESFLFACQKNNHNVLLHDTIMEIQSEFPHAQCFPITAIIFLQTIKIKWTNQLTAFEKKLKSKQTRDLDTQYQRLRFLLDCLPCSDCTHETNCMHRTSKRLRELIAQFNEYHSDPKNAHLMLSESYTCFQTYLKQAGLIDNQHEVTTKGRITLRLNPIFNPMLVECLIHKAIPLDDTRLGASILAGFLPFEISVPINIELRYPLISENYQILMPYLKKAAAQMLSLGLTPQMPNYQKSCLYFYLTSDEDRPLLDHIPQWEVDYFIEKVDMTFLPIKFFS